MNVTLEDLRVRFAARTNDELQDIASGRDSAYTDEARDEARRFLAQRTAEAKEPTLPSHPTSYAIEDAMLAPAYAIRRGWHALLPPDHVPTKIRRLFGLGVISALPAMGAALVALIQYFLFPNTGAVRYLTSGSGVYLLAVAAAGLSLAYGVKTERAYPQYLAVGVAGLSAVAAILDEVRSGSLSTGIFAFAAAAWGTAVYLLRDSEATEYYKAIRHRGREIGAPG